MDLSAVIKHFDVLPSDNRDLRDPATQQYRIVLDQKNPQNVDRQDIEAAGWRLDVSRRHSPSTQATYLDTY